MPQEEGRGPKGPKWALYSVGLVVPHHLKTVNSVSFSTHSVLEDSSKHVGSALCHYGKLPEMVILLRKRFSWLTVSEVAVCDWMDLWLWAGAAGATLWWACMVEQDSLYYKPEARGEREEERSVHTHSESVPLGLKPSHSPLFKPLPPPKHATLGTRPREMEPNYSRWQGRLSFKKSLGAFSDFFLAAIIANSVFGPQGLCITATVFWVARTLQLPLEGFSPCVKQKTQALQMHFIAQTRPWWITALSLNGVSLGGGVGGREDRKKIILFCGLQQFQDTFCSSCPQIAVEENQTLY